MGREYTGTIVEESLEDNRILNDFEIMKIRISEEENPEDRWHLYTVKITQEEVSKLSQQMKSGWYAHFWRSKDVIAVFKDRIFAFNYDNKSSWKEVVEYGLSVGIPEKQLDFVIED